LRRPAQARHIARSIMFGPPFGPIGSVAAVGGSVEDDDWDEQEKLLKIAKQYCGGWAGWEPRVLPEQTQGKLAGGSGPSVSSAAPPAPVGRRRSPSPSLGEEEEFIVDAADDLRALAVGITYRYSKDLEDKCGESEIAEWGSVLRGADRGDGWLRIGDRYLPMVAGGCEVLHRTITGEDCALSCGSASEDEAWGEDPMDRLFRHAELQVAAAEREHREVGRRTRQVALRSSETWRRRAGNAEKVDRAALGQSSSGPPPGECDQLCSRSAQASPVEVQGKKLGGPEVETVVAASGTAV